MEAEPVSLAAAFVAGILSFISPCQIALVPGYISYLSGSVVGGAQVDRRLILTHAATFVLGFSIILVAVGASVGLVGYMVYDYLPLIRRVGGVILIVLGLHVAGVIPIATLYRELRPNLGASRKAGYTTSLLLGAVFAVGWTPCVGPTLFAILLLAGTSTTWAQGAGLLAVYSLGLGLPFLLAAAALGAATEQIRRLNRHGRLVSVASGVFLVFMGMLLFTDQMQRLAAFFSNWVPFGL